MAIIAQNHEEHEFFLDNEVNRPALIDSCVRNSKYTDGKSALSMVFADVRKIKPTLPTKDESQAIQERMGINGLGREASTSSSAVSGSFPNL